MTSFVLQYNTEDGALIVDEFDEPEPAFQRRNELERTLTENFEIVVMRADSLDDLRLTHGRYFGRSSVGHSAQQGEE